MDAYVARQPIFDHQKNVYAYELLFRGGMQNFMPDIDGDMASSQVLSSTFFTIGLDRMTTGKRAFINFTQNLIEKKVPLIFPKDITVVELLEDIPPDLNVIEACKELRKQGYALALDDFVYSDEYIPLIDLAQIIKMDFRQTPIEEIRSYMKKIDGKKLIYLAEKIETNEEFDEAVKMGFSLFQGYFFCKPEIIKGKEISTSQTNLLQVITEVTKADPDIDTIVRLIGRDVGISFKLLRHINSAFFKGRQPISSIRDALVRMGMSELRQFISLIAMSELNTDKPEALIVSSAARGKFCEGLGEVAGRPELRFGLFTVGMFSLIDAIVDMPMERIMEEIPLPEEVYDALVHQTGPLAPFWALTEAYERGEWVRVGEISESLSIPEDELPQKYIESVWWADELYKGDGEQ